MVIYKKTFHFISFQKLFRHQYRIVNRQFLCTKNDSKNAEDAAQSEPQDPKVAAKNKLDSLLASMKIQSTLFGNSLSMKLAKPLRIKQKIKDNETEVIKDDISSKSKVIKEDISSNKNINEKMVAAVKAVASSLGGDPQKTESELIKKLLSHDSEKDETKTDSASQQADLSDLFTGMKIERTKNSSLNARNGYAFASERYLGQMNDEELQASQASLKRINMMMSPKLGPKVNIFGAEPLNIFDIENKDRQSEFPVLELWEKLEEKELDLLRKPPPTNAYEEMIRWTEAGKLWTFPINNEAGMDEEMKVGFHEHVFLEYLLEEGFPKKGPIRHFMDLVIIGLSKNPYITVQRKKDHIEWFRQYFAQKENILRETGAIE